MNIKCGDTYPPLEATLLAADGTPIDLTGATVTFSMKAWGPTGLIVNNGSCEIVDAKAGTVKYVWQADDTKASCQCRGEFKIVFQGGAVARVPNDDKEDILIDISESVN